MLTLPSGLVLSPLASLEKQGRNSEEICLPETSVTGMSLVSDGCCLSIGWGLGLRIPQRTYMSAFMFSFRCVSRKKKKERYISVSQNLKI